MVRKEGSCTLAQNVHFRTQTLVIVTKRNKSIEPEINGNKIDDAFTRDADKSSL